MKKPIFDIFAYCNGGEQALSVGEKALRRHYVSGNVEQKILLKPSTGLGHMYLLLLLLVLLLEVSRCRLRAAGRTGQANSRPTSRAGHWSGRSEGA